MNRLTQAQLDAIETRCEAATPGPWSVSQCEWQCECCGDKLNNCTLSPDACGEGVVITGAFVPQTKTTEWGDYCDMNDADAEFVAHAREDIPVLLAEVKRLREAQRWIPVTERLPEGKPHLVICTMADGRVFEAAYYADSDKWLAIGGCVMPVTHWIPLPDPPTTP